MTDRANSLLEKHFIEKITAIKEKRVGVEIELPIVRLSKEPMDMKFALTLMEYMWRHGFVPIDRTIDGYCYKAENEYGDVFSFDTTWNMIEFSMKEEMSIVKTASRFYDYLATVQKFSQSEGYIVCGRGIHPYAEYIDIRPLNTDGLNAKSEFLRRFTSNNDAGDVFFAIPSAIQTHISCHASDFFDVFNLLRKLTFVDACLFANSLPPAEGLIKKYPVLAKASSSTICFRDEIYRLSEAPNTKADGRDFHSFEDLKAYLRDLSIFIVTDSEKGFRPINPEPFGQYFHDETHPEGDITCFRPLEHISPSRYGTLEVRCTCTQPLSEIFYPMAFYTGIVEMREEAASLLRDFFQEEGIALPPMELRSRVTCGEPIAEENTLQEFLKRLVSCAYEGLLKRGFAEEQLMRGLYEKDIFHPPAQRELALVRAGLPMQEIIRKLSEW